MQKNIFYLVSSPRSGSTLIYNALCSVDIFNPAIPESHLTSEMTKLYYSQLIRNQNIEKEFIFLNKKEIKEFFSNSLNIFYEKIMERYQVQNLMLKSIQLTPNINVLDDFFPNITYVIVIRDPRDIIVSMIRTGEKQKEQNIEIQFPRNIELLTKRINRSYRLYLEPEFKNFIANKVYTIKYEEFVKNPLEKLNDFSNIYFKKNYYTNLDKIWDRSNNIYLSDKQSYTSDLWGKKITLNKVGEYKNFLKEEEILKVEDYCKDIMKIFSYIKN